jgi:hypothetical protein
MENYNNSNFEGSLPMDIKSGQSDLNSNPIVDTDFVYANGIKKFFKNRRNIKGKIVPPWL